MLNLVELNVFTIAAETENFSEAARRLGVTQPTVSVQIRSLEDRLGVDLFDRSGRQVALTEAGRALVPMARDLLRRCLGIEETMVSLRGDIVGLLQIACTTASGKYVLPHVLGELRLAYPRIDIQCRVTNRHDALRSLRRGEVQVALTSLKEVAKDLEYRRFATDRIVLIAPLDHPWAHRTIRPIDLLEGEFISREAGSGTMTAVQEALVEHDLGVEDLPRAMELGNSEAIRMAVSEGYGVGFVSAMVATSAGPENIAIVDLEGVAPSRILFMVRDSSTSATQVESVFWDFAFSPETSELRDRITQGVRV
jgi:LysR family transcriptional regulator, low CO2-responsive transcriptional regulator